MLRNIIFIIIDFLNKIVDLLFYTLPLLLRASCLLVTKLSQHHLHLLYWFNHQSKKKNK